MKVRVAVAALSMSAAGFVSIIGHEGFTDRAIIPVVNDRPTVGFGSTFYADGTPVRMGDTITPQRALVTAVAHVTREEESFRKSLAGASLTQAEFDLYMDFVYQFGAGTWWRSSMRRHIVAGEYVSACNALFRYRHAGGFDCSTPGNKRCAGVWTRQLERHAKCMAAQ